MSCITDHLSGLSCILCKRPDQVYMGHGHVRFCAHCTISWDSVEDDLELPADFRKAIVEEISVATEIPSAIVERMGVLAGNLRTVFAFDRRMAEVMQIPEFLFLEDDEVKSAGWTDTELAVFTALLVGYDVYRLGLTHDVLKTVNAAMVNFKHSPGGRGHDQSTHGRPRSILEQDRQIAADNFGEAFLPMVDSVMSDFEHGGIHTQMMEFNVSSRGTVGVKSDLIDSEGNKQGSLFRQFFRDDTSSADHIYFDLEADAQGKGFGTAHFKHSVEQYREAGIERVMLNADKDVGGYAWAKLGFKASDPDEFDASVVGPVRRDWNRSYGSRSWPLGDIVEPQQLANLIGPDGRKIGKENMLGSAWFGEMDI